MGKLKPLKLENSCGVILSFTKPTSILSEIIDKPCFDDVSRVSDCRSEEACDDAAREVSQRIVRAIDFLTTDKLKI